MARRLRVGLLTGATSVGGTERYLRELARSIEEQRFEPVVLRRPALDAFFAEVGGPRLAAADLSGWEPGGRTGGRWVTAAASPPAAGSTPSLIRLRRGAAVAVAGVKQLAAEVDRHLLGAVLARQDLDLLHVHNGGHPGSPTCLGAVLAAADLQIPTILTVHGIARRRGPLRRVEEALDRRVAAAASSVTAVGTAPARALAELRGFDPACIRVVATGVRPPATPASRRGARAALGLDEAHPVVGSIAAFTPAKGHATLLDSLARVRHDVPQLRAVLAGDGPCRSRVAERARALGLDGAVLLPGRVDPFATLAAFDVFVSASTTEGVPLSILEAMSQGLPVVATAVGGVPEVVVHGETGLLAAPGDVDGLARRVAEVLGDPHLARRMGEAGRRRFDADHRIEDMVATYHRLYSEVLAQPR